MKYMLDLNVRWYQRAKRRPEAEFPARDKAADTHDVCPLLFLHGFMGSSLDFESIAHALPMPSLGVDLPGHGNSACASNDWFEETLDALRHVLETERLPRVSLVGYSLGGRIALHFGVRHPDWVDRIVVASSNPGIQDERARSDRREADRKWARRIQNEWPEVLRDWYTQPVFSSLTEPLILQIISEKFELNDPLALARAIEGFSVGAQSPLWNRLARTTNEILFISGEQDRAYVQIGKKMASSSTLIQQVTIPGAGHIVHREQREAYLGALFHCFKL